MLLPAAGGRAVEERQVQEKVSFGVDAMKQQATHGNGTYLQHVRAGLAGGKNACPTTTIKLNLFFYFFFSNSFSFTVCAFPTTHTKFSLLNKFEWQRAQLIMALRHSPKSSGLVLVRQPIAAGARSH